MDKKPYFKNGNFHKLIYRLNVIRIKILADFDVKLTT